MVRRIIFNNLIVLAMLLVSVANPNLSFAKAAAPPAQQAAPGYAPVSYTCSAQTQIPLASCQALVALYNSTNGSGWTIQGGWLASNTPCSWNGVFCNGIEPFDVLFLWLASNHLSGTIPPQLGNLVHLQGLLLDHNHLSGLVPSALAQLANIFEPDPAIYLSLDHNWLTVPNPYPSVPSTTLETFLMNKAPDWEKTQGVMADILPAAGGEVKSADGHVDVTIPSGGVTQPVTLKLTSVTKPGASTGNLAFANTSFSLTVYDTGGNPITPFSFAKPVTITLSYQDSDVVGLSESQLILYDWETATSAWKDAAQTCSPPSTYLRDPAHNTFSVDVCHLTEFALLVNKNSTLYLPLITTP